ncbi:hypothetical protein CDD82_2879 [Ophiocordyceps australis]|uniref:Zn(2)-C6 fungal-type domain-containing protein n=1 Tax=Ophiocordyceps australis TaxID=1399860 RepID=A0A2C5ZH29_9HYPO|nr:hypothetical protein CDD82_2879 [Ophiocordyceps australis]
MSSSPQSPVRSETPKARQQQQKQQQKQTTGSAVSVYNTLGPDAQTKPILIPGSRTPALNPRSCVTCRRRKVRCDKQMPCSNCRRALIPCVFPAPGRAPRQQRRRDPTKLSKKSSDREVELVQRLRKLEGIVEELSGQMEVDSASGKLLSTDHVSDLAPAQRNGHVRRQSPGGIGRLPIGPPCRRGDDLMADQSCAVGAKSEINKNFGRLVLDDERRTSRYVSSGFWSKLNDELDAIREETQMLTDVDDDDSDSEETPLYSPGIGQGSSSDHQAFVWGQRSADVNLKKLHPPPSHITYLWAAYQNHVEPLVKLLYIPSMDVMVQEAKRGPENLSPSNEALLFAIYYAAVTSLEAEEIGTNFGVNKDDLLGRYRFALEQALAQAGFLDTSEIAVVQAFTLFLIVVRRHDESRSCWSLTGLLIRIAQGLGLHRDGKHFKLPPLETEIRRRLWWAILMLDLRSAEELGTDLAITDQSFDTQMPSNINDSDISAESTHAPEPLQGRSDCAVSLVRCEICALSRRLVTASSAMSSLCPKADDASIAERERMLVEVYQRVEHKFLQHVLDETDPLYWVAAMIARVIMAKMCLVLYQPMLFPGSNYELSSEIRQRLFVAAIEIIEYNHKLNTDARCKQYRWLFKTYTNWHAIAYTLIEVCRRPWTALVERGWEAVNGYDKDPVEIAKRADHAAVFLPLRKLFARARRHREAEIARLKANQDEARQLDFAERMNPTQARFGPVPGAENVMEQVREKWRMLVRPDGVSPWPREKGRRRASWSLYRTSGAGAGTRPAWGQGMAAREDAMPAARSETLSMDFSPDAMEYMNHLMAQPRLNLADFWTASAHSSLKQPDVSTSTTASPTLDGRQVTRQGLGLQTPGLGAAAGPGPLWHGTPSATNWESDKRADGSVGHVDMLGDDFDWKDWSESIRGLEMGSQQPLDDW